MNVLFCLHMQFSSVVIEMSYAGKRATEVKSAWAAVWIILIGLGMAAGGAYLVYKHRLRVSFIHFGDFFGLAASTSHQRMSFYLYDGSSFN